MTVSIIRPMLERVCLPVSRRNKIIAVPVEVSVHESGRLVPSPEVLSVSMRLSRPPTGRVCILSSCASFRHQYMLLLKMNLLRGPLLPHASEIHSFSSLNRIIVRRATHAAVELMLPWNSCLGLMYMVVLPWNSCIDLHAHRSLRIASWSPSGSEPHCV